MGVNEGEVSLVSLSLELVRAFVHSMQIEGLQEPLYVLDEMRRRPDALLRRSPALLEALAVVAAELRHGVPASTAVQQFGPLSSLTQQPVQLAQVRQSLRSSVSYLPRDRRAPLYPVGAEGGILNQQGEIVMKRQQGSGNSKSGQYRKISIF